MNTSFVLRGHLIYTPDAKRFEVLENGYLVVEKGCVTGCFSSLPERYTSLPFEDHENRLIIPGLCDTHLHAPQFTFRGLGMDLKLLEWLNEHAFMEEARYSDLGYADKAYTLFADALKHSSTTRLSVFATLHVPATLLLTEKLEAAGVRGYVGKVSMDRNSPDDLREQDADTALKQVESWLSQAADHRKVTPIITPRFVPSCSDALMDGLAELRRKHNLPLQSHLSENDSEIHWVKELCPNASCYADAYAIHGLMDEGANTVMAHCVHPVPEEMRLLKERDVLVSHCPASNTNLSSGIAPIRRYLEEGVRVGLGTDIAGGHDLSIFRAMADAVQVSKLLSCFDASKPAPLSLCEAFYLGTKGGGTLFGKVGSFEKGYEADILVLDDDGMPSPRPFTVTQRLERIVYLDKDVKLAAKYVAGESVSL